MELDPAITAALLHAQQIGAIGPAPIAQHIEHALGFADVIAECDPAPTSIIDLGTGGGIPGLVLAERFPSAQVTLLDGRRSRIDLLDELLERLGWGARIVTVPERAEEFARREGSREAFAFVVARGFARPSVTAECGAPLLAPGGSLVVSEPPAGSGAERWPIPACGELGLLPSVVERRSCTYVRLERIGVCPAVYPRRTGIPEKRPLF
jgi:16S rRNA (guanine527-N7)-methyltransferase